MRTRVALVAVVCSLIAPCAYGPSSLGLSIVVAPPRPVKAIEARSSVTVARASVPLSLPAALRARLVAGAAAVVEPGPEARGGSPVDLGIRMAALPLVVPQVAPGTSARFPIDGRRRGWVARLEGSALPTPVFWENRVMVGGGFSSHTFYGLDAHTGRFVWSAEASDGGPSAGIAVEDKVLFNTESCTLFCIDPKTGRILWRKWLGDPVMGQPAAANGAVYSGHIVDGTGRYALSALRISDGTPIWKRPLDADVLSAPVISGTGADATVTVTTMSGTVAHFRAADGRELWRTPADATSAPWVEGDQVMLSRRVSEGREQQVVLSARDGSVVAAGRPLPAPYATQRPDAGGVAAGWSYEGSRPVLAAGRAYYAMGSELRARDLATGDEVWRRRIPARSAERGITPPAIAGGALVVGTRAGEVYGIDVDTGVTTFAFRVGEPIASPPIVAKGWVYCTTLTGSVFGLEVGDAGLDGWHMWGGNATHTGPVDPALEPAVAARRPDDPTEGVLRATVDGRPVVVAPRHTRIDARVSGIVARVELDQVFVNPTDRAIDAAYLLPLPSGAAVDALQMTVGDRTFRAHVERRGQARQTFAAARARGETATLLEEDRPNLFHERVANIPARGEVRVVVRMAAALRVDGGQMELALPLVAAPRYAPGAAPPPVAPTRPGDALEVRVEIDAGTTLGDAASPSHEVRVERPAPERAVLTLVPRAEVPNRDFVVRHRVAAPETRTAMLASREGSGPGTFTLLVHAPERPAPADVAARELVLLVDASSSMAGRAFELARALGADVIRTLGPRDLLRVFTFADGLRTMAPDGIAGGPGAVARAERFLDGVEPHGGTELTSALVAVLRARSDPRRVRTVLLVTDGNVADDLMTLQGVANELRDARLHVIGLGAAPNRWLLERAAELGRGTSTIVGLAEDPRPIGARLAAKLARPVSTDLSIDWGGLPVHDVYPRILPDLHAGEPLVVIGKYDGAAAATVTLRGRSGGADWARTVEVTLPAREGRHEVLGALWGRRRVQELETARLVRPSEALREQIARVGLEHSLVTSETSLIAVASSVPTSQAPPPEAAPAQTWAYEGGYWRDELGTYRIASESPAGTTEYQFGDDDVMGELARPEGLLARRAMLAPASPMADVQFELGEGVVLSAPAARAQVAPPPTAPRDHRVMQQILDDAAPRIRAAYRSALERDRALRGRVVLEVTIRPDGSVAFVQVIATSLPDATFQAVLVRLFRDLRFTAGPAQTVEVPIDLRPAR